MLYKSYRFVGFDMLRPDALAVLARIVLLRVACKDATVEHREESPGGADSSVSRVGKRATGSQAVGG